MKYAIISHSEAAELLAKKLQNAGLEATHFTRENTKNYAELMQRFDALIFIGALGICVRKIAPFLGDKKCDPAVVNIDVNGEFIQSVVSGHVGGGNELTNYLARLIGAVPVLSTTSDTQMLWALDLLPTKYQWQLEPTTHLTRLMAAFINRKPTALLLEARDMGTLFLETTAPEHVSVFYEAESIDSTKYDVIIVVSPYIYSFGEKVLYYRPAMVSIGLGAQKNIDGALLVAKVQNLLSENRISVMAVSAVGTVELKKEEPAFTFLAEKFGCSLLDFSADVLDKYMVENPSDRVKEVTGTYGVAEAVAMHLANNSLLIPKQKVKVEDKFATISVALDSAKQRQGFVEIVGAGPGDPQLVTVRGKMLLQTADLILYAGSLVPIELTEYAKPGCLVKSSAGMHLNEQVDLMREFYNRRLLVVRLHTGDPCIYGAIQEQMALMDRYDMHYRITPGVSSFQAAAAALQSQFTIPEEVQTIILTRGEGRTPVPEREQLHKLAEMQSTMCIYLSASIALKVQSELLEHYPQDTPVAVCYKLTWKEEKIWRCELRNLAKTISDNNLTMTTLIVVGKAIDNRSGESKLYHKQFKHAFRL